jgi:predicted permease
MPPLALIARDMKLGFRGLVRDKGFTLTAVLTFALCLGANVALFAVVNAVLVHPLPYPNPSQLVVVYNAYPRAGIDRSGSSVPHYLERRAGIAGFADAAALRDDGVTVGESGSPDRLASMDVTPSFFHVLGVSPELGRTFADEEGVYGKNDVVVLSDGYWRDAYAASPDVLGRKIRINGKPQTIIGVMPASFRYGTSKARVWVPLCFSDDEKKPDRRHSNGMAMIARLRPGTTVGAAQAQLDALNASALAQDPYAKLVIDAGFHSVVADLHNDFIAETRSRLILLQAGVLFLLLIGAVNLANLLLVRASGRDKEFSVRQVLGASRLQIASQLLSESLALAVVGALLGLGLGWAGLRGLEALGVNDLPHFAPYRLDATVCMVAFALALTTGVLLALPALWHTLRGNLALSLSVESRGGTTTRAAHRLRHILIVAQFALAFTLLTAAGLLGLSFSKVLGIDPGFRTDSILTAYIPLPYEHYKEDKDRLAFTATLLQQLRSLPGVASVAISTRMPLSGYDNDSAISIEGQPPAPGQSLQTHYTSGVTGAYFESLGIPLLEGRYLDADDSTRSARVCVVDADVARRYWPGKSALGHWLFDGAPDKHEKAFAIVGVVGATRQTELTDVHAKGNVYFPYIYSAGSYLSVIMRTPQAPQAAAPALRAAVLKVDPELPIEDILTLAARRDDSLGSRRSPLVLAGIFSGVALVLAAVGIYGVLAYAVAQRRREIGVRMALGAHPQQIMGQFLSLGTKLALAGSAIGVVLGWLAGRAMTSMLFGIGPVSIAVFAATGLVLGTVAIVACLLPAIRASRVPPMEALRS